MKPYASLTDLKIAQDVPSEEGNSIISKKSSVIARFISIMGSLAQIYSLNLTNLHIFYDTGGVLIAFNRNGSIFLNLRYYEAWREYIYRSLVSDLKLTLGIADDAGVQQGLTENALISWYHCSKFHPYLNPDRP